MKAFGCQAGVDLGMAGALVAYLYKCKSLSKTGEQLTSIAGVLGFNLVIGSLQETRLDNLGASLPLPSGTSILHSSCHCAPQHVHPVQFDTYCASNTCC